MLGLGLLSLVIASVYLLVGREHDPEPDQVTESAFIQTLAPPEIRVPIGLEEILAESEDAISVGHRESGPVEVSGEVGQGETIFRALREKGVPAHTIQPVINAVGEIFDFRRSRVGDYYHAMLDEEGTITRFRYQVSPEKAYEARLVAPGEYEALRIEIPLEVDTFRLGGVIEGSLYATIEAQGESSALARKIVDILQWDVDFSTDVQAGDAFRIVYEKVYLNGQFLRYGNILAIEFRGATVRQQAYYYEEVGHEGYYTLDGEPLRRMFLKAPCRYRRISSLFDLNRKHPVLHIVRPHLGVDYAASTGTHVKAVADGHVEFIGRRGAAGNLIILAHEHGYKTAYAHLNGFARGLSRGDEIHQGELIGFVGNTGRSTGPHLHFGMKYMGRYIDPLVHSDRRLPGLSGRELDEFKRVRDQLRLDLEEIIIPDVAAEQSHRPETSDHESLNDEYVPHEF